MSDRDRATRVAVWAADLRLEEPYDIAYATVESAPHVFLRLESAEAVGCGCAAPDPAVTGEEPEASLAALRSAAPRLEATELPGDEHPLAALADELRELPAARAAVDMAFHDARSRAAGEPLWRFLGGRAGRMLTSVTLAIRPAGEMAERARERVAEGFRSLKLKGGLDAEADEERVHRVREAVGKDVELRFDANQGYTVEAAVRFLEATRGARLSFVEQPTPKEEPALLGEVRARSPVPVMADESVLTLDDLLVVARQGLADMVNLKLMKVGGISQALRMAMLAERAGLGVMVGCMDEAALSIGAGLALALASPAVGWADLDGHLALAEDPSAGAVTLRDGFLAPSAEPGLGVLLPAPPGSSTVPG